MNKLANRRDGGFISARAESMHLENNHKPLKKHNKDPKERDWHSQL
jgi:hypothetical protein